MTATETLTALMDKARQKTGLTEKISVPRLTELMDHFDLHANPNLYKSADDFGKGAWMNMGAYSHESDWNGLKVISSTRNHSGVNASYNVEAGKTYTFSIYAKASANDFGASFHMVYHNPGKAILRSNADKALTLSKSWKRYSMTFTVVKGGSVNPRIETDTPGTLYLAGYKLELGDLATPLEKVGGVAKALLCALLPVRGCAA